MNLAVGGTNGFFPDNSENEQKKPWKNNSPTVSIFKKTLIHTKYYYIFYLRLLNKAHTLFNTKLD